MEPQAQEAYVELYGDSHRIAEGGVHSVLNI